MTLLADTLRTRLGALPGVHVHDKGQRRCGIVTFTVDGVAAGDVARALSARRVNTSVSLVEYARLDLPARNLPDLVRASVHYYNDDDDLSRLISAVPAPLAGT